MTTPTFNPGDVSVRSLKLSAGNAVQSDGGLDIRDQLVELSIMESIMSPVITGTIILNDSIGLIDKVPIAVLKTKLTIEYEVPGQELRVIELFVTKVGSESKSQTSTYNVYVLELASKEIVNNALYLTTRDYSKDQIHNYIGKILTSEIKSGKAYNRIPTKGTPNFDNLIMKPFQAIHLMTKNAVALEGNSSNLFMFFENKYGFNFITADDLISNPSYLNNKHTFVYTPAKPDDAKKDFYRDVLHYQQLSYQNPAKLLSRGAYDNKTLSLDLRTRVYKEENFVFLNSKVKVNAEGGKPIDTVDQGFAAENLSSTTPSRFFNYIKTSNELNTKEKYLEEKLGRSAAYLEVFMQNMMRIMTWGDSEVTAGRRIYLKIGNANYERGLEDSQSSEKIILEGQYLVTAVKHFFRKEKMNLRYYNSMELVNPSFQKGPA